MSSVIARQVTYWPRRAQSRVIRSSFGSLHMSAVSSFPDSQMLADTHTKCNVAQLKVDVSTTNRISKQKCGISQTGSVYCFRISPPHQPGQLFIHTLQKYEIQCLDGEDQLWKGDFEGSDSDWKCAACSLFFAAPDYLAHLWRQRDGCRQVERQRWPRLLIRANSKFRGEELPLGRGWSSLSKAKRRSGWSKLSMRIWADLHLVRFPSLNSH